MASPRISVIIGIHNGQAHLAETLDSLLGQTEKNWECIAVNDGSTDASEKILSDFAARDPRFRLINHSINKGLTTTLIEASQIARAPYIARQDVDDVSFADRFQRQAAFLDQHPNVALVGCYYEVMDVDGSPLSYCKPPADPRRLRSALLKRNVLAHGSIMFRKDTVDKIGGYRTEFKMAQDYDLVFRLLKSADVAVVPEILYRLRLVPEGGSLARLERQQFYANLARDLYFKRLSARGEHDFIENHTKEIPSTPATQETIRQRYQYTRAVHLVKSGKVSAARKALSECTDRSLAGCARNLRLFSYLPGWIRAFFIQN